MLVKSLFHSNIYFQFLQDVTKVTYQILRKIRLSIANNKLLKYDFETQVLSSQRWDSKFQDCRSKLNYSMKKEKCSTESIDELSIHPDSISKCICNSNLLQTVKMVLENQHF